MSIFDNQEDFDSLNPENLNLDEVKLDTLVGENQKYKTPDDLAKAYVHADARIAADKAALAEREAEIKVLKDLLDKKTVEPNKEAPGEQRQEDPPAVVQPKNDEKKDLSTLVAEELERQNTQKTFAENVNSVSQKLADYYGGEREAKAAIARKAKELNVGSDWLMDVAGRSPAAFYNTLGLDQKSFSTPAPANDKNTLAFGQDRNRRNFKFYEEMRKNEPKTYYSSAVQKEMFAAAREQGDKFYT